MEPVLFTEFIKPSTVEPWYEMAVVRDFRPVSEWKTKAEASNNAVMVERAKTRLHFMITQRSEVTICYTFSSYLFLRFPGTVFVSFTHCALWEIWRFSPQRTNKRHVPYLPLLVRRLKICKNSLLKEIFETFKAIFSVSFQLTYWHVHNIDGRTPWENLRLVFTNA